MTSSFINVVIGRILLWIVVLNTWVMLKHTGFYDHSQPWSSS